MDESSIFSLKIEQNHSSPITTFITDLTNTLLKALTASKHRKQYYSTLCAEQPAVWHRVLYNMSFGIDTRSHAAESDHHVLSLNKVLKAGPSTTLLSIVARRFHYPVSPELGHSDGGSPSEHRGPVARQCGVFRHQRAVVRPSSTHQPGLATGTSTRQAKKLNRLHDPRLPQFTEGSSCVLSRQTSFS